jgi:hypothetical protein
VTRYTATPIVAITALVVVAALAAGCSAAGETPSTLATPEVDLTPTTVPLTSKPTPTPKPLTPGELAARAFVDRVTTGKFSYHVAAKGEMVGAVNGLTIVATVDVSGDNYAEVATYTFANSPMSTVSVRFIGTTRWIRVDRSAWQKTTSSMPSNSPFSGILGYEDVKFVRSERLGGKNRHHLEMIGIGQIIAPDLVPAANLTSEHVDKTKLELIVDDKGTPLTGVWELDGTARVSGQLQGIRIDLDLGFSKVGSKIVIKAP